MSRPGWRARVAALKRDVLTVYFAARDPRLPWPLRALALAKTGALGLGQRLTYA